MLIEYKYFVNETFTFFYSSLIHIFLAIFIYNVSSLYVSTLTTESKWKPSRKGWLSINKIVIKKLQIKNQLKEVKLKNGVNIKNQLIEINVNIKFIIFIFGGLF